MQSNGLTFNLFSNRYFWAVSLIFVGLVLMIGQLFNVSIPVFRLIVTAVLVTAGLQLILKALKIPANGDRFLLLLGAGNTKINSGNIRPRYYTILGSHILDFSNLKLSQSRHINIHTILGETHLYLPSLTLTQIHNTAFLGKTTGAKDVAHNAEATLKLNTHTTLGNLVVHQPH